MRKFSLTLVAAMLFSTGSLLANNMDKVGPAKSLSIQISEMLKKNNFNQDDFEKTAQVRFTLNEDGEIVILSVDTDCKDLEYFVKNRLNYKKVVVDNVQEGKIYTIPVRIES